MSPAAHVGGKSSTFNAAINLAKYCIGAGILALPYATQQGGLFFAPIMIAVIASWNWLASTLLMECKRATSDVQFPSHLSSNFSKIAYAGLGSFGVVVTDVSIIITLLGVCITFQITFATLLREVPGIYLSSTGLTILSGVVVLPMCFLRDLDSISWLSLLGMVCLIAGVSAILYNGIHQYGLAVYHEGMGSILHPEHVSSVSSVPLWPTSLNGATSFLGIAIFCFDICSLAFPIEESMKNKHEFGVAAIFALSFVWLLYVLFGDLGAVLYSHDQNSGISENILTNLPVHSYMSLIVRWAMACVGLLTYPITLAPAAEMVEHYCATHLPLEAIYHPARSGYSPISTEVCNDRNSSAISGGELVTESKSNMLRWANRFIMVIFTTFIAANLPCFGTVISLLGGFTIAILDFILPPLLHIQILHYGVHKVLISVSYHNSIGKTADTGISMKSYNRRDDCICVDSSLEHDEVELWELNPRGREDGLSSEALPDTIHSPDSSMFGGNNLLYADIVLLLIGLTVCILTTVMTVASIYAKIGQSLEAGSC